jgi:hypothetical protein
LDFQQWVCGFRNYLRTIPGLSGIPLDYVVREMDDPVLPVNGKIDYMQDLVQRAPLVGPVFRTDNATVHGLLKSKVASGLGEEWISTTLSTRNSCQAFNLLTAHFTGAVNVSRLISDARYLEKTLHYQLERGQVPWPEFLVQANKMFTIFAENGDPKSDSHKVNWLLDAVHAEHLADLKLDVGKEESRGTPFTYDRLCVYIGKLIHNHSSKIAITNKWIVSQVTAGGGKGKRVTFDPGTKAPKLYGDKRDYAYYKKNFRIEVPVDVWNQFTGPMKRGLIKICKKNDTETTPQKTGTGNPAQGIGNKKQRIAGVTQEQQDQLSQTIAATVVSALTASTSTGTVASLPPPVPTEVIAPARSPLVVFQLGGQVAGQQYRTSVVATSSRRNISRTDVFQNQFPNPSVHGKVELDSHADTCVLGKNFVVMLYSGHTCDVYLYSKDYEAIKGIPIVTAATAVQDPVTNNTYILVFHEALWYGDRMDHSLINQNQLRHYGLYVQDNPFDRQNPMEIYSPVDEVSISLQSQGTIVYFDSRTPTYHELQECRHIVVTSDAPWNPELVNLTCSEVAVEGMDVLVADADADVYSMADAAYLAPISCVYDTPSFESALRRVSTVDVPRLRTFVSAKRHSMITPEELSE